MKKRDTIIEAIELIFNVNDVVLSKEKTETIVMNMGIEIARERGLLS